MPGKTSPTPFHCGDYVTYPAASNLTSFLQHLILEERWLFTDGCIVKDAQIH